MLLGNEPYARGTCRDMAIKAMNSHGRNALRRRLAFNFYAVHPFRDLYLTLSGVGTRFSHRGNGLGLLQAGEG